MTVNPNVSSWEGFYADRTERRDTAIDPATRAHFEAELEHARNTMDALGLQVPEDPPIESGDDTNALTNNNEEQLPIDKGPATEDTSTPPDTGDEPINHTSDVGELSQGLNEALVPYSEEILAAAEATGVPANLLAAVIWDESKGITSAGTTNGENGLSDSGLMQVNPETFAALQNSYPDLLNSDISDPQSNIMAGALYLKENYDQFGSWDLALRAYNSGPLSVDPSDHTISTSGFGTQNYVEKVNFYWDQLNQGSAMPDGYPGGNVMY